MFITEPSAEISKELMALDKKSVRKIVSFLTGFGPFKKHLKKFNPSADESDECRVCLEGGSEETPYHLLFDCEAVQWDRELIFGQKWPTFDDRQALASQENRNVSPVLAIQPQPNIIIRPANSALAGKVKQVSSSSYTVPPSFSFSSWTIKQIHEFVSIDSLTAVYVTHHTGESDLKIKAASTNVQVAPI